MNEVSSRSHAVCMIIVEKCTTILNATNNTDASAAAAAAAMACDNMGLLMAGGGPSSRKAVAAAAALSGKLQHTIKVGGLFFRGLRLGLSAVSHTHAQLVLTSVAAGRSACSTSAIRVMRALTSAGPHQLVPLSD